MRIFFFPSLFLLLFLPRTYIHARFVRRFSSLLFLSVRFTVRIKARIVSRSLSPTVLQRLVSPRREQRIVENLNDRFVRPRLDSYPSTVSFLELLNVARSCRNIAKNKPQRYRISRYARLDSFPSSGANVLYIQSRIVEQDGI